MTILFSAFGSTEAGPQVSPVMSGDINLRTGATCNAGVFLDANGDEKWYTPAGSPTDDKGPWLDSGLASEVWVEWFATSGTWNSLDPGAGRLQLNTGRAWRVSRSSVGSTSVTGHWKFYDAASGGNTIYTTSESTWTATYEA